MSIGTIRSPRRAVVLAASMLGAVAVGGIFLVFGLGAVRVQGLDTGLGLRDPCTSLKASLTAGLAWGHFSDGDRSSAANGDWGEIVSNGSTVSLGADVLARESEYVALVEVLRVGQMRYNTPSGSRPSSAEVTARLDSGRAYAPVVLGVRRTMKSVKKSTSACGFLVPVWMPMGPNDDVEKTAVAHQLHEGLQGFVFLDRWPTKDTSWSEFLLTGREHAIDSVDASRFPVGTIGMFYPVANSRVVGYGAGDATVEQFSTVISDAVPPSW